LLTLCLGQVQIPLNVPKTFEGSFVFGEAAIEKYRVLAMLVGLAAFIDEILILNRSKIGLLIRAGVENREMARRSAIKSAVVRGRVHGRFGAD
jgi:branched-chain amino acid transport system permease protein